jgi:hypothetical protein
MLVAVAFWYHYEPKKQVKKIYNPWGFWNKE